MDEILAADFLALLNRGPATYNALPFNFIHTADTRLHVRGPVTFRGRTFPTPVHFEHIVFHDFVDFADAIIEGGLRLENCVFLAGLRLCDMQVKGALSLRHSTLSNPAKWLDFRRLRIDGLTDFSCVTATVGIDVANSIFGDDWHLHGFKGKAAIRNQNDIRSYTPLDEQVYLRAEFFNKAINGEGVEVRKNLYASEYGNRRFHLKGTFDLRGKIGDSITFDNAQINVGAEGIAVDMDAATVVGSVFFSNKTEVTGRIDLRANIGGQVNFDNVTLNAGTGTAVNMNAATVAKALFLRHGTRILGNIDLGSAKLLDGFWASSDPTAKEFQQPKLKERSRQSLVVGDIDFSYATVHGPMLFHGASIWGKITADHLHVHGDLDWCGSIIGIEGPTLSLKQMLMQRVAKPTKRAVDELLEREMFPTLNELKHLLQNCTIPPDDELELFLWHIPTTEGLMELIESVHGRRQILWSAIETDRLDPPDASVVGLEMKMATVEGHLWFKGTRLLCSVTMEDTRVIGEVNMTNGYVAGNLGLRSTKIEGGVVGHSSNANKDKPATGICGHLDCSYAKFGALKYDFAPPTCATTPTYIHLTGAEVGVLQLSGTLAEAERHGESRGLLVAEGLKFQHIKLDKKVLPSTHLRPTWRDGLRHGIWLALVGVGAGLAWRYECRLLATALAVYVVLCLLARFGWWTTSLVVLIGGTCTSFYQGAVTIGMLFALGGVVMFARQLLRDEASYTQPQQDEAAPERDFLVAFVCRCLQVSRESAPVLNLLAWSYPFSRSLYIAVESWLRNAGDDGRADEAFLMRRRRETGLPQKEPMVLVEDAKKDPALKENWQTPSMAMRFLNGLFDFAMGFGVRWSRLAHVYLLFFLLNTGVFLSERSVERPIAYQQPRFDTFKDNDLTQIGSREKHNKNPWPANGGMPEKSNWTIANAAFIALRLQVPILTLGAENDWEPASRPIFGSDDKKDHEYYEPDNDDPNGWIIETVTYEEYASFMVVANFILIPLIIAGITRQMRK